MFRQIKIIILLTFLLKIGYSQKEANVWFFSHHLGLDFNSGSPEQIEGIFQSYGAGASMSDSLGNFLFATNGEAIYDKEGEIMLNGDNLKGSAFSSQGSVIVQKPGSDNLYYVFTVTTGQDPVAAYGLYYSIVDMDLNGGMGAVTNEKNIFLSDAWDGGERLIAARHANGIDIWIITHKMIDPAYATFLLTKNGVNETAVIGDLEVVRNASQIKGQFKLSYNKKYMVSAFPDYDGENDNAEFEILTFNANTGQIEIQYVLRFIAEGFSLPYQPHGVEFSPDSKFLYLSLYNESGEHLTDIFQLDMMYINDSAAFYDSQIKITTGPGLGLQLATDGKIYGTIFDVYSDYDFLSVIHEPWKNGTDCNYEDDFMFMGNNRVTFTLQNVLLDYLYRFEWEGRCSAESFVFQSNFQPDPVAIQWNFSDPGAGADSISTELNPVHYFTHSGEFEVNVVVQYPNGRIERTSRVVTVDQSPQPDLGPDTLMCAFSEITLNAGEEEGFYLWSNGSFGQNASELLVSDTGWYWVDVTNDVDCTVRDSIHVGLYPEVLINEDNLNIVPTTCGGSSGKILGLIVTGEEPLSFEWYNADNNLVGSTLDITDLPVGNYFLHILDGNGCTTFNDPYTIIDAGDIEITDVEKNKTHCGQNMGTITITASSGSSEDLLYSVDNGNTWQSGNPLFENLPSGNYFVRVKDQSGCEGVYENNPVVIENIPGPEVTAATTSPEIDYLQNGQIDILATIPEGDLYFSVDNGNTFQTNNGLFTNLSAGTYHCMVKDDFGCDTTFIVEVTRTISQLIEAIAGDDNTCLGDAAVVPLVFNNFTGVSKFHVYLTYDTSILHCDGYINIHEDLEAELQVSLLPNTGEVIISWEGADPITLPDNATITELVLGAKGQGISPVDWIATGGESIFYNENGDEISVDYQLGKVRVFSRPDIDMYDKLSPCEGEDFSYSPWITGGSGEFTFEWTGPDNYYNTFNDLDLPNISQPQAGIYTLTVTDTVNCVESKSVEIMVDENPVIAFAEYDTIFAEPGFVLEAGGDYNYYLWNTGEKTPTISINNEGVYSVEIGTTEMCFAKDTVTILWGGEPFWLPNAFSPNGDGLNDEFKPVERYDYLQSYHISIYNRWGQMIFETNDINEGWDGNYKGQPAPNGTYIYKIVYKTYSTGEETQTRTGHVSLVR